MVDAIVDVAATRIMAYPLTVGMNVGSLGMASPITEMPILLSRPALSRTRRTMRRDILPASAHLRASMLLMALLRHSCKRKRKTDNQQSYQLFHFVHHPPRV
jgi:hypothetical protein